MKKLLKAVFGIGFFAGVASGEPVAMVLEDAGPEYGVQGEYAGMVDGEKYGMQVVALGKGGFDGVLYEGGLPGEGWDREKEKWNLPGKPGEEGVVVFEHEGSKGTLKGGVMEVVDEDGKKIGEMKKVERKSPTLGEKAPEGAKVLFDGSSVAGWKDGRKTEDGLLMEGTTTEEKFGSFRLHLEFMLPFKPEARGQGRGNSGVYMQGRYEVQVLDSFGLEGKDNECGGIYSVKGTDVNMCYPPLTWQTYDIEFKAAKFADGKKVESARMTVRHNGVVVHDDVEVPKATTAAPVAEGVEPGPIYLQNHGNPVRFRNIWMVPAGE